MTHSESGKKIEIEIRGLSVTYRGREADVHAVKNCSFSVARGDVVGLVGESGSGKSSALMAIPQLLPSGTLVDGQIICGGLDLAKLSENAMNEWRWRKIALVPQGAMNSFTPHLTVERHITEVLEHHLKTPKNEGKKRAVSLMEAVGLDARILSRYPHELSGGQKQRAALALALACDPDFLLADEPTTALDVITQKEVLETIANLVRDRGMGLILVTHDLPLAAGACDTLIVMKDGAIVESGPSEDIIASPGNAYTRTLIDAIKEMEVPS
ncbi:MAG: ABC transporter ATP-binding protein [Synergistaceae bacterium]|jgi:ABC-type glutathione transport system ATPase component|nr:ABC transporter ATP-binding protein [Synergistaceae bacterium]